MYASMCIFIHVLMKPFYPQRSPHPPPFFLKGCVVPPGLYLENFKGSCGLLSDQQDEAPRGNNLGPGAEHLRKRRFLGTCCADCNGPQEDRPKRRRRPHLLPGCSWKLQALSRGGSLTTDLKHQHNPYLDPARV